MEIATHPKETEAMTTTNLTNCPECGCTDHIIPAGKGLDTHCDNCGWEHDPAAAIAEGLRDVLNEDARFDNTGSDEVLEALTFADYGIRSYNEGLVVRMADGSEYQITIVKSR